ncbi:exodeoxyribonuclease VII small subunit [candidate division WWE3 bacterium]|nr:exodeoxyribonuclease VII small subunit [candidate division WWE3 bacterium]
MTAQELTFTQSLKKLKEITEKLEKGDLELEDALKLYEEGISLHKKCIDKLNFAKLKFEELKKN